MDLLVFMHILEYTCVNSFPVVQFILLNNIHVDIFVDTYLLMQHFFLNEKKKFYIYSSLILWFNLEFLSPW